MANNTTVLITGANRGLGRGLLELFLGMQNHTVIAANRDVKNSTSKSLFDLPTGQGSKLVIIKIDATIQDDAFDAVHELKNKGIHHLDVVIANAGVATAYPLVRDLRIADMEA